MNSLQNKYDLLEQIIFEGGLRIVGVHVHVSLDMIIYVLNNRIVIQRKISSSSRLAKADEQQINNYEFLGGGVGVHWPDVDEDISLKGLLKEETLTSFGGDTRFAIAA